jgi:NADH dehydrogenase [ubiquinone] 1 alpha subcomplex assembly factor 1
MDRELDGCPRSHRSQHMAYVFAPQDEWSVIKFCSVPFKIRRDFVWFGAWQMPLARYLPTWKRKIVESDAEMSAACVTVMGLSLTAEGGPEGREQGPGPFCLELDLIKALRVT